MNQKTIKIVHFGSLFVFLAVGLTLMRQSRLVDGSEWNSLGWFVMGVAFTVGLITRWKMRYPDARL